MFLVDPSEPGMASTQALILGNDLRTSLGTRDADMMTQSLEVRRPRHTSKWVRRGQLLDENTVAKKLGAPVGDLREDFRTA